MCMLIEIQNQWERKGTEVCKILRAERSDVIEPGLSTSELWSLHIWKGDFILIKCCSLQGGHANTLGRIHCGRDHGLVFLHTATVRYVYREGNWRKKMNVKRGEQRQAGTPGTWAAAHEDGQEWTKINWSCVSSYCLQPWLSRSFAGKQCLLLWSLQLIQMKGVSA